MKTTWVWLVCCMGLALAAPLPKSFEELKETAFCKKYQCYNLPTDKQPATDQGVGTYLFLKKLKGSLFIRTKEGHLTVLGWNLALTTAKPTPTQAELNHMLASNHVFIREFTQTFFGSPTFYNFSNCLKPQATHPTVKLEGQSFEVSCYFSSGEILFTGAHK